MRDALKPIVGGITFWLVAVVLAATVATVVSGCGRTVRASAVSSTKEGVKEPGAAKTVASGSLRGDEDDDDSPADMASHASGTEPDNDADFDNDHVESVKKNYRDEDDLSTLRWGRPLPMSEVGTVALLVKRYYADAAAGDGARGCMLLDTLFAESIPEDYGQPPGPPALRGSTCAIVLTKLFVQRRQQLVAMSRSLRVTDVRVDGRQGRAFVGFQSQPAGYVQIRREAGRWKIRDLLSIPLP